MPRPRPVAALLAAALVLSAGCEQDIPEGDWEAGGAVAITGGLVFTSPLVDPIENGVVVILDGIIEAVGPAGEVPVPPGAERIQAGGLSVLAGFWNSDVWIDDELLDIAEEGTDEELRLALEERFTRFGFTTVVDHGSDFGELAPLLDRLGPGGVRGPRIVQTGGRLPPGVHRAGWWHGMEGEVGLEGMALGDVALMPALTLASFPGEGESDASTAARTDAAIAAVGRFTGDGGALVFGTGAGYVPEFDPGLEVMLLDEAGVGFEVMLAALTSEAAGRFDHGYTGLVEPGMVADLVLLEGDPATDLTAFERVRWVLREGVAIYAPRR